MPTGKQIRAARMLLQWDAVDLAKQSGLTKVTILNMETQKIRGRPETMDRIVNAFSHEGIEFIANEGVRFRPEGLEVLNGEFGIERFSDLVFAFCKTDGGTIRQIGLKESDFTNSAPDVTTMHRKRMAELVKKNKNIHVKAILKSRDKNFSSSDYAEYKWYPSGIPAPVPYYIFGDTVCIFTFESAPSPKIILITSPDISATYINQFDEIWKIAQVPPSKG